MADTPSETRAQSTPSAVSVDSAGRPTAIEEAQNNRYWHLSFVLIGGVTLLFFMRWGLQYVGQDASIPIFVLATLFGMFMAFNIGGNDVANSFGTSVGAGTLTIKQALLVAAVFEVSGAVLGGASVTDTVRKGIVDIQSLQIVPQDFIFLMMSALLAAAMWLLFATKMGFPVSTTHSIIGGIVGAALVIGFLTGQDSPMQAVQWGKVGQIAISWVLSPVLGGAVSYVLFKWVKTVILQYNESVDEALRKLNEARRAHYESHREGFERLSELQEFAYAGARARRKVKRKSKNAELAALEKQYYKTLKQLDKQTKELDSHRALELWVPILAAVGALVITSMMLFKGLNHVDLNLDLTHTSIILTMVGVTVWLAVSIFVKSMRGKSLDRSTFIVFSWMQVFTASAFAFSHGSNDIANAIGPFIAILDTQRTQHMQSEAAVPTVVLLAFGVMLVMGLWFIGRNVIKTVGTSLTKMHPSSGFAAELAAALVVMVASVLGLPVSSTHILIGAVLGIGLVNHSVNWRLMRPIGLAWVITLPTTAGFAALSVVALRAIF